MWFWETGKKKVEATFIHGKKNGLQLEYTRDGQFSSAICYREEIAQWRTTDDKEAASKSCH